MIYNIELPDFLDEELLREVDKINTDITVEKITPTELLYQWIEAKLDILNKQHNENEWSIRRIEFAGLSKEQQDQIDAILKNKS